MADPRPAPAGKTPVADGRKRLKAARFNHSGVNAGARGELWMSPSGEPVWVSYIGPRFGQDFSTESLDNALAQK